MRFLKKLMDGFGLLVTAVLGLALFTILMDVPFISIPIQVIVSCGFHLLVGWLTFLARSLPQTALDAGWLASFLIGLGVTAICAHAIMLHFMRQWSGGKSSWRWKWTLSLLAIPLLLFGICVSIQGAVTTSGWLFSGHFAENHSRMITRASAAQLVRLAKGLAESSPGQTHLPNSIGSISINLAEEEHFQRSVIYRDPDHNDVPEYWTWLGGVNLNSAGDVPVAFAPRPDRRGARVVSFLDGTAKECTEEEWQAALFRWRQAMAETTNNAEVR
jgi:hypothetical protein